jgi:phospholipid transport system substrate-binding protein
MRKFSYILASLLIASSVAHPYVQTPLEVIRTSNGEVQNILDGREIIDQQTEAELLAIIDDVTDFSAISSRVIERFCENLTPAQCENFDRVFQRLLRVSSIKKMGRYRAERFVYLEEEINEDTAIVKTLAYYEGDEVHLNYLLELEDGKWMIHNYIVDDVNTIRNYKKQFIRLFARNTFDAIIERLKQKIAEYEKEY